MEIVEFSKIIRFQGQIMCHKHIKKYTCTLNKNYDLKWLSGWNVNSALQKDQV